MHAEDRQRWIVARARARGRLDVSSIAGELQVAPETVRRDLSVLEKLGLIRRVHGGAYPVERAGFEITLTTRVHSRLAEKRRIGAAALARLGDVESVYVDEGSTCQVLAETFPESSRLTVITSALTTASTIDANSDATVLVLGGRLRGKTQATVDHWAVRMLRDMVVDVALIGANGVSRERGLTTPDPAVAAVKTQAMESARRRVLVADHSKFGVDSFCRFADVRDFDLIITDSGLSAAEAHRYHLLGPEVVRA
ncbi:DeoR/GlpR family DNA-binding transcription regulator [Allokutzneria sp. A3M-2-11 16]|uniref:DeoR/GlpR family DNA-binding transcription regulator n=1 Tax=Allokutzneria sp. A3M-2-11 16 TaxID=2962043 RepID=UPI0020B725B5|nr:DeoR/GlpR family DNA-binding transcription regulator [Allokutzneria sp. A3M-2-11 16]MCP3804471.1 DeoR/GlpR family DNA-binding transcription regulator [Allokutzneria sp. A3M-2-11 16]